MAFAGTYFTKTHKIIYGSSENQATPDISASQPFNSGISSNENSQPLNSNEYTQSNYPGILDSELTSLTPLQKNIFIVTLSILFVFSMLGNMCTLVVNFRRKIRPFFRACLISLAFSDLVNTIFITTAYLSQFTAEYVQIWRLGSLMCGLVPFATTAAILASSMTLVGIAVDRYYAVMKAVVGFWNPSVISCIVCMLFIWLASVAISCPVFTIYDILPVYILTEEHTNVTSRSTTTTSTISTDTENSVMIMNLNITATTSSTSYAAASMAATESPWEVDASQEDFSYILVREDELVNMCISDQKDVTMYYVIVFGIIFIPCIGAFFWFNSVIARKLWNRRHSLAISKKKAAKTSKSKTKSKSNISVANIELQNSQIPQTEQPRPFTLQARSCNCKSGQSSSTTMPSSLANMITPTSAATSSTSTTTSVTTNSSREARHLRMFTIILLMMAVFVFLRLPAWIFLLMRMYGSYTKPIHWILYFVFGIMNLASSVLNPLFYTFLTETIQYCLRFKAKVASFICVKCLKICCCCCCPHGKCGSKNNNTSNSVSTSNRAVQNNYGDGSQPPIIMETVREPMNTISCCENFCGCSGFMRANFKCYQAGGGDQQHHANTIHLENEIFSKDSGQALNNNNNNDKDEGVDCNDELDDEDIREFYEYNQRIYTIFPPSLVSSSINSQ